MYEDVIKIHWILSVKLPAPTLLYITEKMHNKTGNSAFTAEFEQSVVRQGVPYQGPKREQNIEEWLTKWLLSSLATPVINDCLAIKYNTRQIRALKATQIPAFFNCSMFDFAALKAFVLFLSPCHTAQCQWVCCIWWSDCSLFSVSPLCLTSQWWSPK